jgi:hypothetical protein
VLLEILTATTIGLNKMKNIRKYVGILNTVKRLEYSVNGNPRFLIAITDYNKQDVNIARTLPDSMEGYSISNYENKLVSCEIGMHRNNFHIQNIKEV